MAFALGVPIGRRPDPQPLRRPHVHRRGTTAPTRSSSKYTPLREVLAGQDACCWSRTPSSFAPRCEPCARDPRPRRRAGDPRPRRLPADHRAVLLRHRHVLRRDELFATQFLDAPHGRLSLEDQDRMAKELVAPIACAIYRSRRSHEPSRAFRPTLPRCITGQYPSNAGQKLYQLDVSGSQSKGSGGKAALTRWPQQARLARPPDTPRLGFPHRQPREFPDDTTRSALGSECRAIGVQSSKSIELAIDRPAFNPVFALEIRQVVQVVLGRLRLTDRDILEIGWAAISSQITPKYSSTSVTTDSSPLGTRPR